MADRKPKSALIPTPDGKHILEIKTEFTISLAPQVAADLNEKITAVQESPDDSFSALAEIVGLDKMLDFAHSDLDEVSFEGSGDYLNGINFRGARLRGAKFFPENSLVGALLEGADLSDATGLTEDILAHAYINNETILPNYIDRNYVVALHKRLGMPLAPLTNEGDGMIKLSVPVTVHDKH